MHPSGDKQLWHRKEGYVELIGHAVVSQPNETLSADYVRLDQNSRVVDAKGNCVYISDDNVIYGEEMHFNLDTRTGTVVGGRVSNSTFTLSGERINKLGEGRFQTHWGEYTTCVDCPNSWSLLAEDVDMEVDGYAYMTNVTPKINDVPAIWLPYLVVPMKTRRQTGFLFPTFGANSIKGLVFVQPFFWAINRSSDMTFGLGAFSEMGPRAEWEGRYALSARSGGKANLYLLRDSATLKDKNGNILPLTRYAVDVSQVQELPWGFTEKLRLTEVSDNQYPSRIGNLEIPGVNELNLASSMSLSYASPDVSGYVAARRYRTLVNTLPDPVEQVIDFDPRTVQAMPIASVTANDRQLFGLPVAYGLTMGLANFTRSRDAFDYDIETLKAAGGGYGQALPENAPPGSLVYHPGVDPIRKSTRLTVTPSLYTTFRPWDLFSVTPSLKYFYYWYTFPQSKGFNVDNLNRSYLLFQTDFSAQLERIYERPDDLDHPRVKHLVRPLLTYSNIPGAFLHEDRNHPFLQQIASASNPNRPGGPIAGYNFDDYDIVPNDSSPESSNYFIPLGNSLNMGLTSQWIRRDGAIDKPGATYTKFIDLSSGVAFNHREYEKGPEHGPQPWTRFFNTLDLNLGRFTYTHLYYYYPYIPFSRNVITSVVNYSLETGLHQGLYLYDRSISMTFAYDEHLKDLHVRAMSLRAAYSLSDYLLPSAFMSYDWWGHSFQTAGVTLQIQSPARCWKLSTTASYSISQANVGSSSFLNGFNLSFDLALNITGTGYGGVDDIAAQATGQQPIR